MKKTICAMLALILCVGFAFSASALEINGSRGAKGTIRRGYYYNGNVSFQLPNTAWTEESCIGYDDYDEITLVGPADVNGFIPSLVVYINDQAWDMDADFQDMGSGNCIRVANQNFIINDDMKAHYDCYINSADSGSRMEIDYIIWFNCGERGVMLHYYTFSSTRSIPDDLPALDDTMTSFTIGA